MVQSGEQSGEALGDQFSAETLGQAVDAIGDFVLVVDGEGTIEEATTGIESTLGYDRDWLRGKTITFLWAEPPTAGEESTVELPQQPTEAISDVDVGLEAADGTAVPMCVSTYPSDETDAILLVARGRSDRVETVQDHRQDRALLQNISDPMCRLDSEGRFERVNDALVEYTGYSRAELLGKSATTVIPDSEYETATQEILELVSTEGRESATFEVTVVSKDGEEILTEVNITALTDHGEFTGSVGVFRDIRERKKRERELTEYRELFNTVGDPMYILDSEGYIERVNDAMVAYTGYDRETLVGREMGEIVPATAYEQASQRLLDLANSEERTSDRFEADLVTKTGEMIRSEATVTALTDESGNYTGSVGTLRDISDQTRRKQELELLKQVLARVFRHNIRNELMVIQSRADLLAQTEEGQEHAEMIVESAQRLTDHSEKARLIEQIVDTDERYEQDLTPMVEEVVTAAESAHPQAQIDVAISESIPITAHPEIAKAIEELVENAIAHAPKDETPTVEIWVESQNGFVTLFVEDESGGLDGTELDVLRNETEESLEHGSGVGLWLVRWLVKHSEADLLAHQTEAGTLMGIRFRQADTGGDSQSSDWETDSLFAEVPSHLTDDISPERVHGETVVGRVDELHTLETAYDELERTGGRAVIVTGETGIGKTTLVETFQSRIAEHDRPPLVATGHCEPGLTPSYHVVQEAMSALPVEADVSDLLAQLSDFSQGDDPEFVEGQQQTLFLDVASELRELARDHPVVIVLEDLQWADQATIDLLSFLVEEVAHWATPILFVGTYNTEQVVEDHPVIPLADRIQETERGTRIELEPFSPHDVQNLLEYMLDVEYVPDKLVGLIHEHTGGNLLFVSEIGSHLVKTLGPSPAPQELPTDLSSIALPDTVESAVLDRLSDVLEPAQSVLELGAVIGERLSFPVLREASSLPEETLTEQVEQLIQHRIWERDNETIVFVHGVMRQKALDKLDDNRLSTLHGRVARAIETVHEAVLDDQYGRLATHYHDAGELSAARTYYRKAGEQAVQTYRHEAALEHYQSVLTIVKETDEKQVVLDAAQRLVEINIATAEYDQAEHYVDFIREHVEDSQTTWRQRGARLAARIATERGEYDRADEEVTRGLEIDETPSEELCRLLGVAAEARRDQGRYETARVSAERQLDLATDLDLPTLRAEALRHLGRVEWRQDNYETARKHFRECQQIADEIGDQGIEAAVSHGLGLVSFEERQYDDAEEHFKNAFDIREEIGDRHGRARSIHNIGMVAHYRGNHDRARERYRQSRDIERELGDRHGEGMSTHNLGLLEQARGEYDSARECYERCLSIDREIGDRQGEGITLLNLGALAIDQGRYAEARERLEDALDIFQDLDDTGSEANTLSHLGQVARLRGEYDEAEEHYEESLRIASDVDTPAHEGGALAGLGWLAYEQGSYDEAVDQFEPAVDLLRENGMPAQAADALVGIAATRRVQDNFETAQDYLDEAWELVGDGDVLASAKVSLERARLAFEGGDLDAATEHVETAIATFESIEATHWLGQCKQLQGQIAIETGAFETADERISESRDIFENVSDTHGIARSERAAGTVAWEQNDDERARSRWESALETFEALGAYVDTVETLESLVCLAVEYDHTEDVRDWCEKGIAVADNLDPALAAQKQAWFEEQSKQAE